MAQARDDFADEGAFARGVAEAADAGFYGHGCGGAIVGRPVIGAGLDEDGLVTDGDEFVDACVVGGDGDVLDGHVVARGGVADGGVEVAGDGGDAVGEAVALFAPDAAGGAGGGGACGGRDRGNTKYNANKQGSAVGPG